MTIDWALVTLVWFLLGAVRLGMLILREER